MVQSGDRQGDIMLLDFIRSAILRWFCWFEMVESKQERWLGVVDVEGKTLKILNGCYSLDESTIDLTPTHQKNVFPQLIKNCFSIPATPIDPSKDFTVDGINGFSKKKKKKRRHR